MIVRRYRVVLALVVLCAVVGGGLAAYRLARGSDGPTSGWHTYTNSEHKYSIDYPKDAQFVVVPTLCGPDGFCVQHTEFKLADGSQVKVFVNFQGGACESTTSFRESPVEVGGHVGSEIVCTGALDPKYAGYYYINRAFQNVNGKLNYWAAAESPGEGTPDTATLDAMVRSFRFTKD
jgi:hypothetical protein